jgi:DNA helicase HerA-like ATPase
MASKKEDFKKYIEEGYTFKKDYIIVGGAMLDEETVQGSHIKIPLKTLNRHGLIAGATGTGKTKTLQVLAEQMSLKGIPSILMDIKGDLSGLAQPGSSNDHVVWRHGEIGVDFKAQSLPVELMSLSQEKGVRLRATISEFGPILLSKILGLNDTQSGVITILFKYCDDNNLPLLDLKDLRKSLQFVTTDGKKEIEGEYGRISSSSVNTIMRKIIELEQQGADTFFGEKSFDVSDFLGENDNGEAKINIIRLSDIQNKPKLFSTFMLSLLAEIYETFPETGDDDKPKLCIFIDEAHLVFKEASSELLDQIEVIIKLIRSKGVGIYFCTQNPTDIPDEVLSQLGLKIQHALRAFTAKDRRAITKAAENYPLTDYYHTDELITSLGIGEALVTCLNEKGIPTPLAATLLRAPITRMDILSPEEIDAVINKSALAPKYAENIDRDSAYEILSGKIERIRAVEAEEEKQEERAKEREEIEKQRTRRTKTTAKKRKKIVRRRVTTNRRNTSGKTLEEVGVELFKDLARGLLGVLGRR